jgi:hypothetical protein
MGKPGPNWATWTSKMNFLPKAFHSAKGAGSLSNLYTWLATNPMTTSNGELSSYTQVEMVILSLGLAMRDVWAVQFPGELANAPPPHIVKSPFTFNEYGQLSHRAENILNGYEGL